MWWIIGLLAFAIVFYLILQWRKYSNHVRLVTAAHSHIGLAFRMLNMFDHNISIRVWYDPYLLGYAQGSIAMMTKIFGGNLSTERKGIVFVDTLRGFLGEEYRQVCDDIISLSETKDYEFERGLGHGGNVAILMTNRAGPTLLADADVQAALRDAPSLSRVSETIFASKDTGQTATAGGALLNLYMRRHKDEFRY